MPLSVSASASGVLCFVSCFLTGRWFEPAGRSSCRSEMRNKAAAEKGAGAGAVVVVAVRAAAREISKTAVVWALTHVVQHGDSILLLVVIPPPSAGICI